MKRSDMLKILESTFSKYENPKNIAERALSTVEEAGMIPPPDHSIGESALGTPCQWEYEGQNHE